MRLHCLVLSPCDGTRRDHAQGGIVLEHGMAVAIPRAPVCFWSLKSRQGNGWDEERRTFKRGERRRWARMERCGLKCRGLAVSHLAECSPRLARLAHLSASRITDRDTVTVGIVSLDNLTTRTNYRIMRSMLQSLTQPMTSSVITRKHRRLLSPQNMTGAKACILRQRAADNRQNHLEAI